MSANSFEVFSGNGLPGTALSGACAAKGKGRKYCLWENRQTSSGSGKAQTRTHGNLTEDTQDQPCPFPFPFYRWENWDPEKRLEGLTHDLGASWSWGRARVQVSRSPQISTFWKESWRPGQKWAPSTSLQSRGKGIQPCFPTAWHERVLSKVRGHSQGHLYALQTISPWTEGLTSPLEPPLFLSIHRFPRPLEEDKTLRVSTPWKKISEGNLNKTLWQGGTTLRLSYAYNGLKQGQSIQHVDKTLLHCTLVNVWYTILIRNKK